MKIGPPLDAIQAEVAARLNERSRSGGPAPVSQVLPTDKVELSRQRPEHAAGAAPVHQDDVDPAKVAALRTAMAEGRFEVRAEVVADKMISEAAELLHTIAFGRREQL